MKRITYTITLTFFALIAGCGQPPPPPTGTVITNVTVIDAISGVREGQQVLFDGDEIITVQPTEAEVLAANTIDGSGKFLIPGLWDFHIHLSYEEALIDSMPALFLSYGITSVRDTGGLIRKVKPIVERMRADGAVAPRVFFAGPLLDGNFVVYDGVSRPEIGIQNSTPEAAKANVAELKAQGVDFVKLYEMVSPDVFAAIVEAANEHGLPIDSHVPLSMRASTAGPSLDSLEHLRNVEMDCASNSPELHETRLQILRNPDNLPGVDLRASMHTLQRLPAIANYDEERCDRTIEALSGTTQVPTLRLNTLPVISPHRRDDWGPAFAQMPESIRQQWQESIEQMDSEEEVDDTFAEWSLFLTGRMHQRDVPIGAGTDTPIGVSVPGYSLHTELELLVRAGLSPIEAIRSATLRPAEFFSLQDEMGSISSGKKADMVLLDANPLDNIANTRQISTVISQGRVFTPGELSALF